jgi:predicted dehydrogenase
LRERTLPNATTPWHFADQLRQFCDNLARDEPPATTAEDGIRALRALLAIYESETSGVWTSIGAIATQEET